MLRFRHLRLRCETATGPFGADLTFDVGLNVIWAPNTTGKSTCLQALLYALGLERMLSPRREIPLTYVMTSHLDDPDSGERHQILESSVLLEIENSAGRIITVRRHVVGGSSTKLISVFEGDLLTGGGSAREHRDYYVLDPGAAQREAGFHRMLAAFIGWHLPTVKRYDGAETLLYLETIFPLLYVEQKAGWSAIPAAFPTYFQIRDVAKRATEFILDLDTHGIELARQQLTLEVERLRASWSATREQMIATANLVSARVVGLPTAPTMAVDEIERSDLLVLDEREWRPLDEWLSRMRALIAADAELQPPTVQEAVASEWAELERLTAEVAEQNAERNALFRARQAQVAQKAATERRLAALEEDLQKNQDAQKLRALGSVVSDTLAADHCPTCAQPIQDTLLAQSVAADVMPVEDNIEYIKSQRQLFQRLLAQTVASIEDYDRQLLATAERLSASSARLRALKADLVAPANAPSLASVQERVRRENQLAVGEDVQQRFEEQKAALIELGAQYAEAIAALRDLPGDRLSAADRQKLKEFVQVLRVQATEYGFSTFPASELDVSPDTFRPQKEGFEIGFELSASDSIRLKWAYQLGLMELARTGSSNHPGFVVFDEPRQQETAKVSFKRLLERASTSRAAGQQVIFATSEDRDQLEVFLEGLQLHFIPFESRIVRRL